MHQQLNLHSWDLEMDLSSLLEIDTLYEEIWFTSLLFGQILQLLLDGLWFLSPPPLGSNMG